MATVRRLHWSSIAKQAIVAGLAGGILMEGYLWVTTLAPAHGSLLPAWQWIASTAIGKAVAFSDISYAWLGLALHLVTAMVWAGGYAFLAATRPYMNRRWWLSGLIYGFIVYLFMQIALLADNNFIWPANPGAFLNYMLGAHMIFYGLPVAFVVSRMDRATA